MSQQGTWEGGHPGCDPAKGGTDLTCVHIGTAKRVLLRAGTPGAFGVTAIQVLVWVPTGSRQREQQGQQAVAARLGGMPALPTHPPGPGAAPAALHARGSRRDVLPPAQACLLGKVVVPFRLLPQVVIFHTLPHRPRAHLGSRHPLLSELAEEGPRPPDPRQPHLLPGQARKLLLEETSN